MVIVWRVTERRNFRCGRRDADSDEIRCVLPLLPALGARVLVSWIGGEPLLWRRVSPCSFTSRELGVPLCEPRLPDDVRRLPARFRAARRVPAYGDCPSTATFAKFERA